MQYKNLPSVFLQALLIATAAVLALVVITRYVSPIPLSVTQTTTQKESAFAASGKSIVTTIPDKAEVTLGISRKEADIKQAQSKSNEIINTINAKLGEIGISKDDIKTQNYSIYPNYDYQSPTQRLVGYSVDISLTVSLKDFAKLNQVIDLATAAGANQVSGIQFTISDELERKVKQQARIEAINDARKNAEDLANLSGVKLGKVINVVEGSNSPQPPIAFMDKAMGGGGGGSPTNVQPGSTTYTYTVTLSYETL
jgi:uncharacterized protein YggE